MSSSITVNKLYYEYGYGSSQFVLISLSFLRNIYLYEALFSLMYLKLLTHFQLTSYVANSKAILPKRAS